ncbi:response regulator [candidate division KSB1 bacterium]|nr:response regulator [candidate division KSB1 bacterium]
MAHILVVDDEIDIRLMLKKMLERDKHNVSLADDGNTALKILDEEQPDIMITDLIMPDKEGIETIIEVRKKHPNIKIIAISGGGRMGPTNYLRLAKSIGAARTFTKPFRQDDLLSAVNDLLKT